MQPLRIDIHRHPIKNGEILGQQTDPQQSIGLPVEGLHQAQERGGHFAAEFAAAPEGTVVWALSSKADRTQEARHVFDMELKAMAGKLNEAGEEFEIIDLEGKMPDAGVRAAVDAAVTEDGHKKKVILVNGPASELMGYHDYDIDGYAALTEELGSEEELIARWQTDESVSRRIGVNYEDVASGFDKMLREMSRVHTEVFPDREVWVKAFGHSAEVEVALATWANVPTRDVMALGKGGIAGFLESARIQFDAEGQRSIMYRGKQF